MKSLLSLLLVSCALHGAGIGFHNGFDYEARAWRSAVAVQSGTLSAESYQNGLQFMLHSKQWGLRPTFKRVNLYLGTDKNALEAPPIHDIGSSTDTLTGKSSFTYSETGGLIGVYGGGLSAGGITCINPNISTSELLTNSCHYALYILTPTNETSGGMGGYSPGFNPIGFLDVADGGNSRGFMWGNPGGIVVSDSNGIGFYSVSRTSSTNLVLYKNGASIGTDTTASGGGPQPIIVHAQDNSGDIAFASSRAYTYYAIGLGLDAAKEAVYQKLVQHVQINAKRAVGSHDL